MLTSIRGLMAATALAGALFTAAPALADTYQVVVGWTDPTAYNPGDDPSYEARWRVGGGACTSGSPTLVDGRK